MDSLYDRLEKNENGGVKDDKEKLCWSLLPFDALEPIVKIVTLGAKKYTPDNWRRVERHRYEDAMMRHYAAFKQGEALDPETGLSHLAHMACNVLFLVALYGNEPADPPC